jgi:hypothetical protein
MPPTPERVRPTRGAADRSSGLRALRLPVALDGRPTVSETLLTTAGDGAATLSTTLADLDITVRSTYLGHPDTGAQVAHLAVVAGAPPHPQAMPRPDRALPVTADLRLCVVDHAYALLLVLEQRGHRPHVDLRDARRAVGA